MISLERDDDKENSPKEARIRFWRPRRLFLDVLKDRDRPFLREVDCGALLHVRDLAEMGQMFRLHNLSMLTEVNHLHTGIHFLIFSQENFFCAESFDVHL